MEAGEESHHKREGESPVPSLSVVVTPSLSLPLFFVVVAALVPSSSFSCVVVSLCSVMVVALPSLHYKT